MVRPCMMASFSAPTSSIFRSLSVWPYSRKTCHQLGVIYDRLELAVLRGGNRRTKPGA